MLTLKRLKEMKPHTVFASGETVDSVAGCNVADTGETIKWVAVRGYIHDWCIFTDNPYHPMRSLEDVVRLGDKIHDEKNIKFLVPCDEEAFKMYNH